MFKKINKLTIIAPHPDDELMGCLTLFKMKKVNKLIIVTNGEIQMIKKTMGNEKYIQQRRNESINFAKIFGLKGNNIIFLRFKDNQLIKWPSYLISKKIKKYISTDDFICIPSEKDQHPDHKIVSDICKKLNNKKIVYSVTNNLPDSKKIKVSIFEKKDFLKHFYPSQYWRLIDSKFPFRNYEQFKILQK